MNPAIKEVSVALMNFILPAFYHTTSPGPDRLRSSKLPRPADSVRSLSYARSGPGEVLVWL